MKDYWKNQDTSLSQQVEDLSMFQRPKYGMLYQNLSQYQTQTDFQKKVKNKFIQKIIIMTETVTV